MSTNWTSVLPFHPYCPSGIALHVCNTTTSKFVGCCRTDPCTNTNGCAIGNPKPASFDPAKYGTFSDQNCDDGLPYSCNGNKPAFLGCCKSNPCAQGSCPTVDLVGMSLSKTEGKAADYAAVSSSATSSSVSTSSSTSISTSTALPVEVPHQTGLPTAAIVGIAVGGALFVALALVIFFLWRRTKTLLKTVASAQGPPEQAEFAGNLSGTTYPAMAYSDDGAYHILTQPGSTLTNVHQHINTNPTNRTLQSHLQTSRRMSSKAASPQSRVLATTLTRII